jgi:peptidoglycan hydrolase-like protein with peptidoglycan-binding domain
MEKKTILIGLGGLGVAAVLAYAFWPKASTATTANKAATPSGVTPNLSTSAGTPANLLGLYNRAMTMSVADAQKALAQLGYNPGPITGVLSPQTVEAIKKAQSQSGIAVTGQLDAITASMLALGTNPLPKMG